jgi:hypothetical protein
VIGNKDRQNIVFDQVNLNGYDYLTRFEERQVLIADSAHCAPNSASHTWVPSRTARRLK